MTGWSVMPTTTLKSSFFDADDIPVFMNGLVEGIASPQLHAASAWVRQVISDIARLTEGDLDVFQTIVEDYKFASEAVEALSIPEIDMTAVMMNYVMHMTRINENITSLLGIKSVVDDGTCAAESSPCQSGTGDAGKTCCDGLLCYEETVCIKMSNGANNTGRMIGEILNLLLDGQVNNFAEVEPDSTCTGGHQFCCPAPQNNPDNCPPSARTSDCDAKKSCCCA